MINTCLTLSLIINTLYHLPLIVNKFVYLANNFIVVWHLVEEEGEGVVARPSGVGSHQETSISLTTPTGQIGHRFLWEHDTHVYSGTPLKSRILENCTNCTSISTNLFLVLQ